MQINAGADIVAVRPKPLLKKGKKNLIPTKYEVKYTFLHYKLRSIIKKYAGTVRFLEFFFGVL